ncbi:MAG TPA: hypothetical protein VL866_13330 [Pyrinomonadaceae bacterium]|nr:hypothetical protein [Pyrinomonadaceae bacterium]
MKKTIQRNVRSILRITVLLAALGGTVFVIVHAGGLAIRPVAKISGDLVITDESGARQAVVSANVDYLQSTKEGTAHLAIRRDGVRIVAINARINADTQEQAAAAVSALVLRLTNRSGREGVQCSDINERGGLQCSDIKFEGDHRVLTEQADQIIDWWDAHAQLTHPRYESPVPDFTDLGQLQFNVHGTDESTGESVNSCVILFFDPANPGTVVGGKIYLIREGGTLLGHNVVHGSLGKNPYTPFPGDFILTFFTEVDEFGSGGNVLILNQPDGTFDLRGSMTAWPVAHPGTFTVEGVGNTKFVVPGQ